MPINDARFRRVFAGIVTGAWAISFVLDAVVADYHPFPGLHGLMIAVAGWIFGVPVAQAARGKADDE